jgi:hypothetical protein
LQERKVLSSATLVEKMDTTHFNAQTKALFTVRAASLELTTQGHARSLRTRPALKLVIKRELRSKSSNSKETRLSFETTNRTTMQRPASLLLTGRVQTTPPDGQTKVVIQTESRTTAARGTRHAGLTNCAPLALLLPTGIFSRLVSQIAQSTADRQRPMIVADQIPPL